MKPNIYKCEIVSLATFLIKMNSIKLHNLFYAEVGIEMRCKILMVNAFIIIIIKDSLERRFIFQFTAQCSCTVHIHVAIIDQYIGHQAISQQVYKVAVGRTSYTGSN